MADRKPTVPAKPRAIAAAPVVSSAEMIAAVTGEAAAIPAEAAAAVHAAGGQAQAAVAALPDPVPLITQKSDVFVKGLLDMATSFDPKSFAPNADAVKSLFGDMQSRAQTSMDKGVKMVEEMSEFAKGNVEAMMASGRVAAKGAETLGQEAAEYGKKSFESATTAFKSFAAAKSPTELFKLQSDYARASFDAAIAEGSKLTEAWLKLAGEVAQPLSSRVAVAAAKVKAPLAS